MTARLQSIKVKLDIGSKTASAIVVTSDNEPDVDAMEMDFRSVWFLPEVGTSHAAVLIPTSENLETGKDEIGRKGASNGDLELKVVVPLHLLCKPYMLIHWLEPSFDIPILVLVEPVQLPCLCSFFCCSNWPKPTICFTGGSDQV